MSIRPATDRDVEAIRSVYEPMVRTSYVSFEEEVPSADEIARRLHKSIAWFVFEQDGLLLGYAYAGPFFARAAYRLSAEVSVYVTKGHQRRGIGRHLLETLLDELRKRRFANAFAGIALPNERSVALFESFGFRRVALFEAVGHKLGEWRDVGWWQLRLSDPVIVDVAVATADVRAEVDTFLQSRGATRVARLGELIDARDQPALVARRNGRLVGVLTYVLGPGFCEILTLHAAEQWRGAGSALINLVEAIARSQDCDRLFLITTNDNVDALRFYQKKGFALSALHRGAVDESRVRLKPEIPVTGEYGIPLRDELVLEKTL